MRTALRYEIPFGSGGTFDLVTYPFIVQRERFLLLTAAIAAVHCAPPPGPVPQPAQISAPQPSEPAGYAMVADPPPELVAEPEQEAVAEAPAETELACDNDVGEISCDFTSQAQFSGPACEGFTGSCELLKKGYGYKRRVAGAIASCWEREGRAACNIRVRQRCNREGLRTACPDPQFTAPCQDALQRCRDKRRRPDFDLDECTQALSSLEGGNLDWAKDAIGPSAEGCKLMFPVY